MVVRGPVVFLCGRCVELYRQVSGGKSSASHGGRVCESDGQTHSVVRSNSEFKLQIRGEQSQCE